MIATLACIHQRSNDLNRITDGKVNCYNYKKIYQCDDTSYNSTCTLNQVSADGANMCWAMRNLVEKVCAIDKNDHDFLKATCAPNECTCIYPPCDCSQIKDFIP